MNRNGSRYSRYRGRLSTVSPEGASLAFPESRCDRASKPTEVGNDSRSLQNFQYYGVSSFGGSLSATSPEGTIAINKNRACKRYEKRLSSPRRAKKDALHNHVVTVGNPLAEESSGATNKPDSTTRRVPRYPASLSTSRPEGADTIRPGPKAEVPVPNDVPVFPLALFHPGDFSRRPRRAALTSVSEIAGASINVPHRAVTWYT